MLNLVKHTLSFACIVYDANVRCAPLELEPVGKGQVVTSPSPLSPWGQFPIFTGVRISHTGRPQRYCPLRGVCRLTFPCTRIVQVILCEQTNRRSGVPSRCVCSSHTPGPSPQPGQGEPSRSIPVGSLDPCHATRPPALVGVSFWSLTTETSAGHAVVPKEREPRNAPRSPPPHLTFGHGLIVMLIHRLATGERRGTSSVRCSRPFLQATPPRPRHVLHG